MNTYLLIAGLLCILLGIVHSILGEILIFKNKRMPGTWIPSKKSSELREGHLRIIWATWHLASIFGWAFAGILIHFSLAPNDLNTNAFTFIIQCISYVMLISGVLVLIATKGKHPGWIVLLLIAILLLLGNG